ncbi:MAG: SpoIVB peptidase [Firmicutes bacterium]|nr:SpoIVB peptidase [Bacillota bacterium]
MRRNRFLTYLWWGLLICFFLIGIQVHLLNALPKHLRVLPGDSLNLRLFPPYTLVSPAEKDFIQISEGNLEIGPTSPDQASLLISLWGMPVREMVVEVVPELKVMPGGQAIGVLLAPAGLIVVDHIPLLGTDGKEYYPAQEAGIRHGDILLKLNNATIYNPDQLRFMVERSGALGQELDVELLRNGQVIRTRIRPVEVGRNGGRSPSFLLGLWLEDPAAGVGTLTFYDERTGRYGALGHMITDAANRRIQVNRGHIVQAQISGVQTGLRGRPGEKIGIFQDERDVVGTIDKNTRFGIFGKLHVLPGNNYYREPIPVALAHQVKKGPAEILTVLEGEKVERFAVEIIKVNRQRRPDDKGLVIQITDSRLLERTGGIIQGMSGSPIIQDGRLVGAVTHVFISDPTRGFGIMAEWMLYESGIGDTQIGNPPRTA